jgi:hypothetical protein
MLSKKFGNAESHIRDSRLKVKDILSKAQSVKGWFFTWLSKVHSLFTAKIGTK